MFLVYSVIISFFFRKIKRRKMINGIKWNRNDEIPTYWKKISAWSSFPSSSSASRLLYKVNKTPDLDDKFLYKNWAKTRSSGPISHPIIPSLSIFRIVWFSLGRFFSHSWLRSALLFEFGFGSDRFLLYFWGQEEEYDGEGKQSTWHQNRTDLTR